ncbi:hypothetical protein [Clostridium massiliamazoniense]|uniref:hypothetical protein n=1 Tax=Clostridium massiliamazoniense TaxID=1347366 RepID=UPI0006D77417|nr:hypothetical protein [Clostridium massiliamazoniense]
MEVTKKRLLKESTIWVVLIIITFIGTNIYNKNKPENIISDAYQKIYNYTIEVQKLEKSDITAVQECLDNGRKELSKLRKKIELNDEMNSQFNSLSSQFDKTQESIITVAKEKIKLLQVDIKEGKDTKDLREEINNIIKSLENGNSKRAKSAAENLNKIMDNL